MWLKAKGRTHMSLSSKWIECSHEVKTKLDPYFTPYTNTSQVGFVLNMKGRTIKIIKDDRG